MALLSKHKACPFGSRLITETMRECSSAWSEHLPRTISRVQIPSSPFAPVDGLVTSLVNSSCKARGREFKSHHFHSK